MGYIDLIIPLIPIFVSNLMIRSFYLKSKKLSNREERRKKAKIEDLNIAEFKAERQKSRLSLIPLVISSAQRQKSRLSAILLAFFGVECQNPALSVDWLAFLDAERCGDDVERHLC